MNQCSTTKLDRRRRASLGATRIVVLTAWSLSLTAAPQAWADAPTNTEYTVKAVVVYNFLKFVDWPKEKMGDADQPLIIGIIGTDVFHNAFDAIRQKTVDNRQVVVKHFKGVDQVEKAGEKEPGRPHPQIEAIRKSHLLFLCPSERPHIREILRSVGGHHVLTVADTEGFLEAGGIINLLLVDEKVAFEINVTAAKQAGLQIRSKLLRLAKRIYPPPEE